MEKNLGGDRLGSGAKMNVELHNYSRSTHDLGYIWRSSMAPGTLVPFLNLVGLPGDTFEIDLDADVKTYPTLGPLFGSFKEQLDVFMCPMRLYNGLLHNNKLGIGLDMSKVKLPLLEITANNVDYNSTIPLEFQQIDQSSLLAYLGIRGLGRSSDADVTRKFNAIPFLCYWDVYKNYYANKQEEIGAFIHTTDVYQVKWEKVELFSEAWELLFISNWTTEPLTMEPALTNIMQLYVPLGTAGTNGSNLQYINGDDELEDLSTLGSIEVHPADNVDIVVVQISGSSFVIPVKGFSFKNAEAPSQKITIDTFPLANIDEMREDILAATKIPVPFLVSWESLPPYGKILDQLSGGKATSGMPQEGLALKTYQSDIFNNWLSTEWIDGPNGINEITAISTVGDKFTLDTLNLANKVYNMLNRIAVSGGSYNDWIEAVYGMEPFNRPESPVYCGGLSKEVVFQEVVSTAETKTDQINSLGSLGGRGTLAKKHKGGYIKIKCTEPCVIMGIVSLTPRIDYSQGNDWAVNLKTLDDLHKPGLDAIGFQDLQCETMAFWNVEVDSEGNVIDTSAGKQPAWLNYMTNFNKCYGNFADSRKEMYMTLNRRYVSNPVTGLIEDLTTYIDPTKFNYMFAQTTLDAQNFWSQISVDITARRLMSAKIMPNL